MHARTPSAARSKVMYCISAFACHTDPVKRCNTQCEYAIWNLPEYALVVWGILSLKVSTFHWMNDDNTGSCKKKYNKARNAILINLWCVIISVYLTKTCRKQNNNQKKKKIWYYLCLVIDCTSNLYLPERTL